jgi:hypothetical protein
MEKSKKMITNNQSFIMKKSKKMVLLNGNMHHEPLELP